MIALAVRQLGQRAVRATGVKSHTQGLPLAELWAPPQAAAGNAVADAVAGAAAGDLDEPARAFLGVQGVRADAYSR
eukprot:4468087-Alexandrium_andersonii.AAC.1